VAAPLLAGIASLTFCLRDNFVTVIPGQVYRSGQMSPSDLEWHVRWYGLRSVINLRGSNPDCDWYQEELAATERLGVSHYDFDSDGCRPPNPKEVRELIALLHCCEKPVLFHCYSGIDRTGIVAAICVLLLDEGGSPAKAHAQFAVRYGHWPWRASTVNNRAFVTLYEDWLNAHGYAPSNRRFEHWAFRVYDPPPELDNRLLYPPGDPRLLGAWPEREHDRASGPGGGVERDRRQASDPSKS
jgi:protein tyrosine phosphatase (PTP) superfamily phosphohydrolase (DUF442 family)